MTPPSNQKKKNRMIIIAVASIFIVVQIVISAYMIATWDDRNDVDIQHYAYLDITVNNVGDDPSELDFVVYIDDEICWTFQGLSNNSTESERYRYEFLDDATVSFIIVRVEATGGVEGDISKSMLALVYHGGSYNVDLYV